MPWAFRSHPAVKKDLRRVPEKTRDFIFKEIFPKIVNNPYAGEPLHGPLKGIWKCYAGEHRIAYSIDSELHEVVIIEVGARGGFYERLRRRIDR